MINVNGGLNKPREIYTDGESSTVNIQEMPYFDENQYDLTNDKDYSKYIADIERMIRNSFEYRWLINYLKDCEGMDECAVLEHVTSRDNSKVKIEIHHSPLTLFDIVNAVVQRRLKNNENMSIWAVAYEVMYMHYAGCVGLIPLSTTVHELVHNAYFFIPVDKVFGNYRPFVEYYHQYLDPAVLDAIDSAEKETNRYDNSQMDIFNNHKIYINTNGYNMPVDNTRSKVRTHIDDIKNNYKTMCSIISKT